MRGAQVGAVAVALAIGCGFSGGGASVDTLGGSASSGSGADAGSSTAPTTTSMPATATGSTGGDGTGTAGCGMMQWYPDGDNDGFGDDTAPAVMACDAPMGHVDNRLDCDDTVFAINPDAQEVCGNADDDCDGKIDEYSPANTACDGCIYETNQGIAYMVCSDSNVNWQDAQNFCLAHGGNLVSILSQEENDFVDGLTSGDRWTGLTDRAIEDTWVWADASAFGYESWDNNEPNGGTSQNCVEMQNDGNWHDTPCDDLLAFVCKDPTP